MRILVIGSGGREHALLTGLSGNGYNELTVAPGNAGMAALADVRGVDVADPAAIVALARDVDAELVVIGPEVPLVAGAADALQARGDRRRRLDLDDEVDRTHVDAELEAGGGDDTRQGA